jgi:hypothetical protein
MRRVVMLVAAVAVNFGGAALAEAQPQRIVFEAVLTGANETPAPGVLTGAFGNAVVTWDPATQTVSWVIDVWNMPSGTNNAHFHVGGPGVAGPTWSTCSFPRASRTTIDSRGWRPHLP